MKELESKFKIGDCVYVRNTGRHQPMVFGRIATKSNPKGLYSITFIGTLADLRGFYYAENLELIDTEFELIMYGLNEG